MQQLILGNAITELRKIKTESIDLVVTDCPYLISGGGALFSKRKMKQLEYLIKENTKKEKMAELY